MRYVTEFTKVTLATIAGFGLGAVAMYVLDPVSGRRRRAIARDKAVSTAQDAVDTLQGTARDLTNRAKGVVAETTGHHWQGRPGIGTDRD